MANEERGEATITLEGVEYGLRPSFTAIQAIEARTKRSIFRLALAATALDLHNAELGVIVGEMLRAWGVSNPDAPNAKVAAAVDDKRVAEIVFEEGSTKIAPIVGWLLRAALTGGVTSLGEPKAAWLMSNPRPSDAA
jgi:hypothetical protein